MNPLEPRLPGPETVMPQAWGIREEDEECASERENRQTARGGLALSQASGDAGRGRKAVLGYAFGFDDLWRPIPLTL